MSGLTHDRIDWHLLSQKPDVKAVLGRTISTLAIQDGQTPTHAQRMSDEIIFVEGDLAKRLDTELQEVLPPEPCLAFAGISCVFSFHRPGVTWDTKLAQELLGNHLVEGQVREFMWDPYVLAFVHSPGVSAAA